LVTHLLLDEGPMTSIFRRKLLTSAVISLAALSCDRSRADLDHATELLEQVIAERDSLKSKLEASQRKISHLENEVAVLSTSARVGTPQDPGQRRSKTSASQVTAVKSQRAGQKGH
jgi:hypothetical protein